MIQHVIPLNDLKPHEETSLCNCYPKIVMENGNMIFVHNSYDKRELVEQVKEIINGDKRRV